MRKSDYVDNKGVLVDGGAWSQLVESSCDALAEDGENYIREEYYGEDPRLVNAVATAVYDSYSGNRERFEKEWLGFFADKAADYEFTRSEFEAWAYNQLDPEYADNLFTLRKELFYRYHPQEEMKAYLVGLAENCAGAKLTDAQRDFVFGRIKASVIQNDENIIADAVSALENNSIRHSLEDNEEENSIGAHNTEMKDLVRAVIDEYADVEAFSKAEFDAVYGHVVDSLENESGIVREAVNEMNRHKELVNAQPVKTKSRGR